MSIVLLACFATVLFAVWMIFNSKSRRKYRFPPQPKGNFISGNAFQLKLRQFSMLMAELGKKFDDAYTIRIFNEKFVVLNSYDMIKEGMTSPKYARAMSGRPPIFLGDYLAPNDEVLQTYSKEWVALRKIVFRGLRTYGTHMEEVEELVQEELKHLMSRMHNQAGKSVDPYDYITGYVISILLMLITGQHSKPGDIRIELCSRISDLADSLSHPVSSAMLGALPWIRHIPLGLGKEFQELKQSMLDLKHHAFQAIENNDERKTCFLDFMLAEKSKGNVTEDNIFGVCFLNLMSAGIETSRSTLRMLLLVLTSRPDVQSKIQEEIDREIGSTRLPCADDKHRMPYTQAVLWETLRLNTPVPVPIPHYTMEDVELRDYLIPKDTNVFYNMWGVCHDEKFWNDPWEFRPSRFLDDNGELVPPEDEKRQRMISFGIGARFCIGEALARLRIFLVVVAILQNFTLRPDQKSPLPDTDPRTFDVCFFLTPPRYKVIFHRREAN